MANDKKYVLEHYSKVQIRRNGNFYYLINFHFAMEYYFTTKEVWQKAKELILTNKV
jgi:hypothetical protein